MVVGRWSLAEWQLAVGMWNPCARGCAWRGEPGRRRVQGLVAITGEVDRRCEVSDAKKCAHPACECTVQPGGIFGKYCSDHCKQAGDRVELRCDCQHPACR